MNFWEAKETIPEKDYYTYSLPHTEETVYMSKN